MEDPDDDYFDKEKVNYLEYLLENHSSKVNQNCLKGVFTPVLTRTLKSSEPDETNTEDSTQNDYKKYGFFVSQDINTLFYKSSKKDCIEIANKEYQFNTTFYKNSEKWKDYNIIEGSCFSFKKFQMLKTKRFGVGNMLGYSQFEDYKNSDPYYYNVERLIEQDILTDSPVIIINVQTEKQLKSLLDDVANIHSNCFNPILYYIKTHCMLNFKNFYDFAKFDRLGLKKTELDPFYKQTNVWMQNHPQKLIQNGTTYADIMSYRSPSEIVDHKKYNLTQWE